ncbi:pirin family protein [Aestuariispira ectoiniformans]|uniref:pirin family protein n=1 Tax=Aestuariispira ectoiniformans TaxID=2775080 RepID=UPI00223B6D86|nr:pirin family protein [Aestuariispira ectoiniformans]
MVKYLNAKEADLGEFTVRRVLPHRDRRMVGPFIFFDHMGPVTFQPGQGVNVRPHPHIGLATVTYLFEGSIFHRDSLGHAQEIRPGDINWMVAGRGIVHSERETEAVHNAEHRLNGLQLWIALPDGQEEMDPSFSHHAAESLPVFDVEGVQCRLMVGEAFGHSSPVPVYSPMFYMDFTAGDGQAIPLPGGGMEAGLYSLSGRFAVDGETFGENQFVYVGPDESPVIRAEGDLRLAVLGGVPFETRRHVWWNFVASSKERIEQAKADWKEGRFDMIEGDDEFIPLPGK